MIKNKAYKFRIYPNQEQKILISKTLGCCRFVFNHCLSLWNDSLNSNKGHLSYGECSAELPKLKTEESTSWLKEVDSTALQSSVRNLGDAFTRYCKKLGQKPKFKSKNNPVQSYTSKFTNNNIRIENKGIVLPKLGNVKAKIHRIPQGRIINASVERCSSGKFFVSLLVEEEILHLEKTNRSVGIDVGIKDFVILSDGTKISNPKFFRAIEQRLAKAKQSLSLKYEQAKKDGRSLEYSMNYQKQKRKVAKLYQKMVFAKNDFLHKLSWYLINNFDTIGLESLDIEKMRKDSNLALSVSEASWYRFKTYLKYKADWYGKTIVEVDRYFPSSQLCSVCHEKNPNIKNLNIRVWTCDNCGSFHDRDINSAINILNESLRILSVGTTDSCLLN